MATDAQTDGSTTYQGIVRCRVTEQPIAGAKVVVNQSHKRETLVETTHITDEHGCYEFTVSDEHAGIRMLYIRLDVTHDDFVPVIGLGNNHSMMLKNHSMGGKLWFSERWLSPAAKVTGRVVDPDGKPMAGVKVTGYSEPIPDSTDRCLYCETDEDGRFSFNLHPDCPACIWIKPEQYACKQLLIDRVRGDVGTTQLSEGVQIEGSVSDFEGRPAAGMRVRLDNLEAVKELRDTFHSPYPDMDRLVKTDEHGRFVMPPVAVGNHQLGVKNGSVELPGCFRSEKINVTDEPGQRFDLKAVEHVYVRGESFDHEGQPRNGHLPSIAGKVDGDWIHCRAKRTGIGKFEIRVPKGLADYYVSQSTDQHHEYIIEYENHPAGLGECHHLQNLKSIDEDSNQFRVTWYECSFLLVKVKQGGEVLDTKDVSIRAQYEGARGSLCFVRQPDGRHRSDGLLPGRELNLQISGDGFEKKIEGIVLGHKEIRELIVEI